MQNLDGWREIFPNIIPRPRPFFRRIFQIKYLVFLVPLLIFIIISRVVFDAVYNASKLIIDEEFHLPQGMAYCEGKFSEYNIKITTLPGLYIISAIILGPFGACSWHNLRFVNLVTSALNFFLYYMLSKDTFDNAFEWKVVLAALNMAILPPLYFFSHVYYTDVLSVTFVLFTSVCFKNNLHMAASIFGLISVLMRQTNILWVGMYAGIYILREYIYVVKVNRKNECGDNTEDVDKFVRLEDLQDLRINRKNRLFLIKNIKKKVWINLSYYVVVLIMFAIFLFLNKGIVVGDKAAHKATLHIPQLFYFSFFFCFFGWPHIFEKLDLFYNYVTKRYFQVSFWIILFMIFAYYNTIEHEYLLADNRHFTFYIWQRLYQKFDGFRYAMSVVYLCGFYVMMKRLYSLRDLSFMMFFIPATFFTLCLQRMIEVRYFLMPYLIIRLQFRNVTAFALILEFITFFVVNLMAFQTFFDREVFWDDYDAPQRILW